MNKYYYERKAEGICVQCGKNPAEPDHVCCAECMERNRSYRKQWNKDHDRLRRSYNADWQKKRRDERQAHGLCIQCGAPRMAGSKCFCERCYEKSKASAERQKAKRIVKMMNSV